jgi:hypothetical protein
MRLSSQNNQFIFNLPIDFIEDYLYEEFERMMVKNFVPYDSAIDYINSTIQEIFFPGMSFGTVDQTFKRGKKISWKEAGNIVDKFTNELDITFRSIDSWINYYMLQQILVEFYLNCKKHYIPTFSLQILDKDGSLLYTILFGDVLLKSISEVRLGYQKYELDNETFTVTFQFNWIYIYWELDDDYLDTNVSIYDIPIDFKPGKLDRKFNNQPYTEFDRKSRLKIRI